MKRIETIVTRWRAQPRRVRAGALLVLALVVLYLVRPRSDFLDPNRPEMSSDWYVPGPVPASVIAAPVQIPLSLLGSLLEKAVPEGYGDLAERHEVPDHDRAAFAYELKREPFHLSMDENRATIRTTIRYGMRFFYDPPLLPEVRSSCGLDEGEDPPRLGVALEAPIAVDRNWRLRTDARVVGVRPASETDQDRCSVTVLDLDLTGRVVDAARSFLEGHLDEIDSIAAAVDLRSTFEGWWQTLQEPIQLADSLWLALRPETVQRGAVRGSGDSLEIAIALQSRPTIVYGPRPDFALVPLPLLDTGAVSEGLDLRVESRIPYDAAGAAILDELGDQEFHHGGRTFRVDSLAMFPTGADRLALELVLSGDLAARLFLVGTPVIDPETGQISVPDLDFDVSTRDVVLAAASWIRADDFRDILRKSANWPAAPAVEWLTGYLTQGLNRKLSDQLRVEGKVTAVRILGVHALQQALLVEFAATGSAGLFVAR
jgi:hypothetical protein